VFLEVSFQIDLLHGALIVALNRHGVMVSPVVVGTGSLASLMDLSDTDKSRFATERSWRGLRANFNHVFWLWKIARIV